MKPPSSFAGHFRDASDDWAVTVGDEPVDVSAAWLQYRVAREVWVLIAQGRLRVDDIARALGQSPEAQRKKLSGSQPAALTDVVAWIMTVGEAAYDAFPRRDADLFPAAALPLLGKWKSGRGTFPRFDSTEETTWQVVVAGLAAEIDVQHSCGRTHLLTSDWVRQRSIAHLEATGITPQKLRLKTLSQAAVLQIGVTEPVISLFDLISRDEGDDAVKAIVAALRIRTHFSDLAVSGEPSIAVIAALGTSGESVLAELLPPPGGDSNFVLGPFEPRHRYSSAEWWSRHQVEFAQLASAQAATGGAVQAVRVLKVTSLPGP